MFSAIQILTVVAYAGRPFLKANNEFTDWLL